MNKEILRDIVYQGLSKRYEEITDIVKQRADYELNIIDKMGFNDYFLNLYKVKKYCSDKEWVADFCERKGFAKPLTGYVNISIFGRGSGIGSIVAYGMGVSCIDPIKYNLSFERFLNVERISMPDFDTDVSRRDRQLLIEILNELFPYVSNIGTNGLMKLKTSIKDVGKVLNVPFQYTNSICKKLSDTDTLEDFFANESLLNEFYNIPNVDHEFYIQCIKRICGLCKSVGKHAGGVILCGEPVDDYLPCRVENDGRLTTEVDMHFVEDVGFVKYDFLGLKTLDVLSECELKTGVTCFDITNNLNDENVLNTIKQGKTLGVFQFEGDGITNMVKEMKVNSFDELAICNALYRPSGLDNEIEGKNTVQHMIDRKNNREPVVYFFKEEEKYLGNSYGLMIYQEQIMQRVRQLTGCSLGKADVFRRAVGKKDAELLKEQLDWFIETAMNYRFTESPFWDDTNWRYKIVQQIKSDIEACGRYCFNASHAYGYSAVGYCCAYYATYYPEIFYCAMLNNETDVDGVKMQLEKLQNDYGIKIVPPDVNSSGMYFTQVESRTISFGLSTIKNMGKSAETIVRDVENRGRYSNLYDFLFRLEPTQCNKSAIMSLAKAGALDSISGMNRCTLVKSMDNICKMRTNRMKVSHRKSGDYKPTHEDLIKLVEKNDKKIQFDIIEVQESKTMMADWENESLGYYITCSPLDDYKDEIRRYNAVTGEPAEGYYVGTISSVKEIVIKNGKSAGKKMAFLTLSCLNNTYEVTVFNGIYESDYENIVQGNVVVVKGKRNEYNGNVSVVAEYVREVNLGVRQIEQLHLYLDIPLNPLKLNMLRNTLTDKTVGSTNVYFHVPNKDKDISIYVGCFMINNFVLNKLEQCGTVKYGSLNG